MPFANYQPTMQGKSSITSNNCHLHIRYTPLGSYVDVISFSQSNLSPVFTFLIRTQDGGGDGSLYGMAIYYYHI